MIKKLNSSAFLPLVLVLVSGSLLGATNVGGVYHGDTTWTSAGSPYVVTSNITIQGTSQFKDNQYYYYNASITIEAGVVVKFMSGGLG